MNRRKFIKTGFQVGGAGLMASTLGCQGSLFDSFAQSANEAIVTEAGGTRRVFKVNLNNGAVSLIVNANVIGGTLLQGLTLKDQDTALVTSDPLGGELYKINLNNNTVQLLTSGFVPGLVSNPIAMENSNSLLIGTNNGNINRMNLSTFAITKTQNIAGNPLAGIAVENSSSAVVLDNMRDLYRVNLSDFSSSTLIAPVTAGGRAVAINTVRNLAFIGHTGTTQIERFDLSTNTPLTVFGAVPGGAGRGIAFENSNSVLVGENVPSGGLYRVNIDTGVTSRVDDGSITVNLKNIAVRFQ